MEQWVSLLFLALQPREMLENFAPEALANIPVDAMQHGAGVREPLAQGFTFAEYPMKGSPFEQSPEAIKRCFYRHKKDLPAPDRAAPFLRGDLFDGHFTEHGRQLRFHLGRLQFEVQASFINSLDPDTIWVHCDLLPPAQEHPNGVFARNFASFVVWEDPARRLGIRIGGLRKNDQQAEWIWVRKGGNENIWIPRLNYIVDWLEGVSPTGDRPRRWYPGSEGSRGQGTYTRHPIDFDMDGENDLFDDWNVHVEPKDYRAWYDERAV